MKVMENPVQPNAGNDGGLGVTHVQGTTAIPYGLNIFGSSNRDSDRTHGGQIRNMLTECNYDPACAQEFDERAHLIKVLDVAARILVEGIRRHGDWDHAVEYYRTPARVGRNLTWRYLQNVKKYQKALTNSNTRTQAANSFQSLNDTTFDTYISNWHEMSNNWGLPQYKREKGI